MSIHNTDTLTFRLRRSVYRSILLAGVSAVPLLGAGSEAGARPLGGPAPSPSAAAIAAAQSGAQNAAQAARQAGNALKRATQSIQAMQASQTAARNLAQQAASTVPNGLRPGGLQVAPGAIPGSELWQGAKLPTESVSGGRTNVTVEQTQQKAILNWQTFNVGKETDLYFDQRAGGAQAKEWIALNRVLDPSASPSRILGSIKADGQVYIVNQNGIIFGGASQVNVATLVASSLSLSNEQFLAGINKPLVIFDDGSGNQLVAKPTFGYLGQQQPVSYLPLNSPDQAPPVAIGAAPGNIDVQAGAVINTAVGGKAMLFAPKVVNSGQISAPGGQVLMAAGEQIYLYTDHTGVRGLDVVASSPMRWMFDYYSIVDLLKGPVPPLNPGDPGGSFYEGLRNIVFPEMAARAASVGYSVVNNGIVETERGNITIVGREIVQNGGLFATTRLNNQDGSIRLRAWEQGMVAYGSSIEGAPLKSWSPGTLILGPGSATMVTPDLSDVEQIEQSSLATRYQPGRVELRGKLIDIEAGASVIVPAGTISIVASTSTLSGEEPISGEPVVRDGSRVYIGENAYLSVAGLLDIAIAMERNFIEAELRINELRDSPFYRDSWLRGVKVVIDRRRSGRFTSGPMAGVEWGGAAGEWVGTPLADVSGWVGVGKTDLAELSTKGGSIVIKSSGSLITREGSLLDVSGGSVRYSDGWNNTTKLLGADGRVYDIGDARPDQAYIALAGGFTRHNARWGITQTWTSMLAKSVMRFEKGYTEGRDAGSIQFYAGEGTVLEGDYWGGVVVGERQAASGKFAAAGKLTSGALSDPARNWLLGNLIVTRDPTLLPKNFTATTVLDPTWYSGTSDPANDDQMSYRNRTTYLDSDVLAQSQMGSLTFYVSTGFVLGQGEKLELAPKSDFAVIANTGTSVSTDFKIDGTIRIAGGDVRVIGSNSVFGAGAKIDVSGEWVNDLTDAGLRPVPAIDGGTISTTGKFAPGVVLDVSGGGWLKARGKKLEVALGDAGSIALNIPDTDQIANLDLRGYAGGSGGQLDITTGSSIQIGGAAPTDPSILHLSETLFSERGFRALSLRTDGDIVVREGATVTQLPVSVVLGAEAFSHASGASITEVGSLATLRLSERIKRQPTSLGLAGRSVTVEAGSVLRADVRGGISASSTSGDVTIRGTIEAPAGGISLAAAGNLTLAAGAKLLAVGVPVIDIDARGLRAGEVLSGGSVVLGDAPSIVIERGSLVDVSGSFGEIEQPLGRGEVSRIPIASNGGTISLTLNGTANDLVDGTFVGRAGGPGAVGGTVNIEVKQTPESTPPLVLGALYYRDRDTGQIKALNIRSNLDIYKEYSDGANPDFQYSKIRTTIQSITSSLIRGGGLALVDLDADTTPDTVGIPLSSVAPTIAAQIDLLSKYFYTDSALTQRVVLPNAAVKITKMSADTVRNGGFGDFKVRSAAFMVAPGIDLSFGRSIAIEGAITSGGAGTASLNAPYVAFLSGSGTTGAAGAGKFVVSADVIDVTRAAFSGFAETQLVANELRMGGLLSDLTAMRVSTLTADGPLKLTVGQIYPATGVLASIKAGTEIVIEANGATALPLAAAGSLTFEAPVIAQNGVVRAPFGSITFKATESVTLGAGSITSVSGDGLFLPYGVLSNNEYWKDPTVRQTAEVTADLTAPPEKKIVFDAPSVKLASGSVVDIRGGGDLYAREFVPGPGGSHDVLAMPNVYAVMPGYSGNVAPSGSGLGVGDRIWLGGGNGLAAGWYTLLPASYAALPGAYTISLAAEGLTNPLPNAVKLVDGSVIMAGRRGNSLTGIGDQLSSSWRVMSGAQLRQYTEYNEAFASTFFASEAFKLTQYRSTGQNVATPRLPVDGGSVVFKASEQLVLDGQLRSQAGAGGRGGLVDIASTKVAILGANQDAEPLRAAGYLVLDSASLSGFGASSLLIGGTRTGDPLGLRLDVTATDIVVKNSEASALRGPEIILAASGLIDVGAGSVIVAEGEIGGGAGDLVITPQIRTGTSSKDYGALIRLSNGDAVRVVRENVDTTIGGVVTVGDGARLAGGKTLLIDATQNTELSGTASLSGTALSVASGRIGLGGGSTGLVLSQATLAQLNQTQHLTLRSYSSIDFYSSIDLAGAGLASVTFDAAALAGYGTNHVAVTGGMIALENSGGNAAANGTGSGALALTASQLVLGRGAKSISGFDQVILTGTTRVVGDGSGTLDAGHAAITLVSPVLTGRGGASQSIATTGALVLTGAGAVPTGLEESLGTRLSLRGGSVVLGSRIVALGGAVEVAAGAGGLTLGSGAVIDVGGFDKQFFDVAEYADAGRISLTAVAGGNVVVSPGAVLNLSAHAGGGNAGQLTATASGGGTVVLDGTIQAWAGAGGKGGAFALDIAQLPDFAAFADRLNAAGFTRSRQFRIRSGDVTIAGSTQVENFQLTADQGRVTVAGLIDARAPFGGTILITGGNGLVMTESAALFAGATNGEGLGSGRVTLEAAGGSLDVSGGIIDVAGGEGGKVRFRAQQTAGHNGIAVDRLAVTINGARSAVLEGVSVYNTTATSLVQAQAVNDAQAFSVRAGAIAAGLNLNPAIRVMAGIEIRSAGDLTIDQDWNLFADFGGAMREGTLTLRAAGNLIVNGNISDGFDLAGRDGVLQDAASWNLRLVAGADLGSASALATTPLAGLAANSGTLTVGDASTGKLVRTGTGDIDIRAGRNLNLAHYQSVIYTAGRKDTTTWSDFAAPIGATYGVEGGHLDIVVGGSISSALPDDPRNNQLFVEWLKRQGETDASYTFLPDKQSTWWVDYSQFAQGVGALGSGNVSIDAGGDLVNLLVALPTNGRVRGGRTPGETKTLEVRNGGRLDVKAGGAIRAGYYYTGRGAGSIVAGETAIGRTVNIAGRGAYDIAPVIALGDSTMSVHTAGDLRLQTVLDPLLLSADLMIYGGAALSNANMSGYTNRTSLSLVSVGGDVTLVNQGQFLSKDLDITPLNYTEDRDYSIVGLFATNLYPSITRITALNGDIANLDKLFTAPGSRPELRMLAGNDIYLGQITMARATAEMMPSPFRPLNGTNYTITFIGSPFSTDSERWAFQDVDNSGFHAMLLNPIEVTNRFSYGLHGNFLLSVNNPERLPNADDHEPSRIYARNGSIKNDPTAINSKLTLLVTNEETWLRAGTDIRDVNYQLRNVHLADTSVLEAGNDIIGGSIQVQGPGMLALSAGRDVYGQTLTLYTNGNRTFDNNNRPIVGTDIKGLPEQGAAISVMAGLHGKTPSYDAFMAAYLDPANIAAMPDYLKTTLPDGTLVPIYLTDLKETRESGSVKIVRRGVVAFVEEMTGETLSPLDAWARFTALPRLAQESFMRQVYIQELREAGVGQSELGVNGLPRNGGYNRGYAAIEVLFPGKDWKGDVTVGNAQFRTMAGGNIEVMTPGGGLQVAALGTVAPAAYGLVTLGYGDINIFARNNVTVNRSRILTFAGGDEVIWSTLGDIDAGRGAKTARVPTAPEIVTDVDAVTEVLERADISGSGIGTIIGFSGVEEGDVHLIAPEGTVNAGDAGVRVSGNLTLAARFVVNADNFQVSGAIKGLPKPTATIVPITVETKDKAAADAAKEATQQPAARQASIIIVEVLGFGGGDAERDQNREQEEQRRRNQERHSYNPNGNVQVLGYSTLSDSETIGLTEEESRAIRN